MASPPSDSTLKTAEHLTGAAAATPSAPTEAPSSPASSSILLNGLADSRHAFITLLTNLRRSVQLYTPVVDSRLYNDEEVLSVWRRRSIQQPRLRFQLLLPPAHEWRHDCPHLLQTVERLSSAFELRTLPTDQAREGVEFSQGMIVADEIVFVQQADPRRFIGLYSEHEPARAREWLGFFRELWAKSEPDVELRRMRV